MSAIAKLRGHDLDRMVQRGAFLDVESLKLELIYGELRFLTRPVLCMKAKLNI